MLKRFRARKVKLTQIRNFLILLGAVVIVFIGYICFSDHTPQPVSLNNQKDNFANPLDHVDPESVILEHTNKIFWVTNLL